MTTVRDDLASITHLADARTALAAAQRRRLTSMMRELSELEGDAILQAAGALEPYERMRLAGLFDVAADRA